MNFKSIIEKVLASFESNKAGYSARKLTSFALVAFTLVFQSNHATDENIEALSVINWSFACLLLGLVTAAQLIEFKVGHKEPQNEQPN